jgi:uncharacterized protein
MRIGSFFAIALLATAQQSPPLPYSEENVSYANPAAAGVVLAGTLTEPRSGGPFPTVLLISGAGPQDRDETISGRKPFLVLADYLTRRGIAVLRVDDRGTAQSTGNFDTSNTQDFASDAEAGMRYLLTRSDIDAKHVGLIGHGEGAIVAPMVAVKMPQISFLVLLAATAVPGEQVLLEQTYQAEAAAGIPDEQLEADERIGKVLYKLVRAGKSETDLREALFSAPSSYQPFLERWKRQLHHLETPWLRFFLAYDPAPALEKVKCPVLALDGAEDTDVVPDQNVPVLKAALKRGHNRDVTVRVLPDLNYMFESVKTGAEAKSAPETMSPLALNLIGSWIAKHTD